MDFTIYDSNGHYIGAFTSSNGQVDPAMIPDGGTVIEGLHDVMTMLVDGQVVALSGAKLDEYNAELLQMLRVDRNKLLAASDWTQSPDSPLSEAQQQSWRDYRQALRDLPENTTDPLNPTWPSKPS